MEKLFKPALLLITVLACFVVLVSFQKGQNLNPKILHLPGSTQTPTLATTSTTTQPVTQNSPDGKKILTMKKASSGNEITYTFSDADTVVFTRIVNQATTLSIPFNSWSPDDKYFFVKETTPNTTNYYVYPSETNITDFFTQKLPNSKLVDVTGWASPTLLIVNTNKMDGGVSYSYWFDITSKSFIQLATRFN